MMAASDTSIGLLERLPQVRGSYAADYPLARITWFKVGGPADVLFRPRDDEDLAYFLKNKPKDVPVTVIGVGSNLLVRDGGVRGVVVRLGREFNEIEIDGYQVRAGAGALDINVARQAQKHVLAGLEFLVGIPGTIGGALRMNAGAYGREVSDVFVSATAVDPQGTIHDLSSAEMGFSYRHADVPEDWIFTRGLFAAEPGDSEEIGKRMEQIRAEREGSQPVRTATGGSTFKNPTDRTDQKAWQLIDAAGCRGLKVGGAMVSKKHTNFLVNAGNATAQDIEDLGEEIRRRVKKETGIELEWEIRRIGEPAGKGGAHG